MDKLTLKKNGERVCERRSGGEFAEMEPGIYDSLPFEEYLEIDAISNSYLSRLAECPAKAQVPRPDSPSLAFGRAAHKFILEGTETFFAEYAVAPQVDRRTKAGKNAWREFEEQSDGKTVISVDDFTRLINMRMAVYDHPMAAKLLGEGVREQTVIWREPETWLLCKCRPDALPDEGRRTLVDLKTARDAGEHAFTRSVVNYGYARQAAFYLDAMNSFKPVGSQFYDSFVFVVVETEPPHRVECYVMDDEFVDWGRAEYRRLLQVEMECQRNNQYPHYQNEGLVQLYRPKWLYE